MPSLHQDLLALKTLFPQEDCIFPLERLVDTYGAEAVGACIRLSLLKGTGFPSEIVSVA